MKTQLFKLSLSVFAFAVLFTSCGSDDEIVPNNIAKDATLEETIDLTSNHQQVGEPEDVNIVINDSSVFNMTEFTKYIDQIIKLNVLIDTDFDVDLVHTYIDGKLQSSMVNIPGYGKYGDKFNQVNYDYNHAGVISEIQTNTAPFDTVTVPREYPYVYTHSLSYDSLARIVDMDNISESLLPEPLKYGDYGIVSYNLVYNDLDLIERRIASYIGEWHSFSLSANVVYDFSNNVTLLTIEEWDLNHDYRNEHTYEYTYRNGLLSSLKEIDYSLITYAYNSEGLFSRKTFRYFRGDGYGNENREFSYVNDEVVLMSYYGGVLQNYSTYGLRLQINQEEWYLYDNGNFSGLVSTLYNVNGRRREYKTGSSIDNVILVSYAISELDKSKYDYDIFSADGTILYSIVVVECQSRIFL